jgi:CRP-like cAMP-binding protein
MKDNPPVPESAAAVRANHLLSRLAGTNRERLLASCERIELAAGQVLLRPGLRATHAWFPIDAIVSLGMAEGGEQHSFELALVGSEGMVGIPLLLGSNASSLRATVVRPGAALRIAAAPLRLHLRASEAFRERMQQYMLVSLAQLAQAALCTRYHRVEERLARWLLMTQDRAPCGPVYATHEFLAAALGVRRAGVTHAAATLQRRQLIAYHRGVLTVLDREGLQAAACGCYAADCASYAQGMKGPALA